MVELAAPEEILESVPYLLKMPSTRIWIDYDDEADVLYISFQKPQHADESELKDNIIYHYRGTELVGSPSSVRRATRKSR